MARQLDGIDIRKLQVGNQQAVRQWFEQYADPLYRLVFWKLERYADGGAKAFLPKSQLNLKRRLFSEVGHRMNHMGRAGLPWLFL